eukprot:CAMPEP_0183779236 /NCGR_PEP_ID=MMETSP0739-20130205/53499_1 /TAXON_ID=385413 /ORGANISM="Thalassiosira miniscula, Strain CCMP1093" /LENGTH=175 /DNA_ID=CAMNT_0026021847 /DNA_START=54 /DNA_END=581 /DNA_ORIENTATION=+
MDYEDSEISVTENLFCHGMDNATNTCEHVRQETVDSNRNNTAVSLTYKTIAYGANQLELANFCSETHFDQVVQKIQNHQESRLGLSSYDFPMKCLEHDILERMFEVSMEHRRNILYHSPLSVDEERRIEAEYWEKMEKKACDPDIEAILELPTWVKFFDHLKQNEADCPTYVASS